MRKQHYRLNLLMEGILKCDRILAIDQLTGPYLPFQNKYKAIRQRLYKSYSEQLATMAQQIITHELQSA